MYRKKRTFAPYRTQAYHAPAMKKRRVSQGLVPTYRGFNPRNFIRGEWKYKDTTLGTSAVTTAGLQILLNGLAPGNSAETRVGMKVELRSLELRFSIQNTPTTGLTQAIRVMIIMDKQTNGVSANYADYMANVNVYGMRNLAQRKRFRCLWDRQYPLSLAGNNGTLKVIHTYLKFRKPIVVEYNDGVAGTVADISSGSIFLVAFSTQPTGTTDASLEGYSRIRYTDL